ncbi:MAG: type IX secretion system membrane protein PorP/SprF [Bacteroidetes bacterium]|nr:MAG: type IX secretion system membrane protein PorP/SprF [Bacteroidota bacterium]REK04753.1 MAG: type IX secretion system membrane protein PorP/SprF [Bacteroidota bacterium]REK36227.1 MAG: type IX secretion system membrane protein PorP/SprF [Bacteroidota bacterium]
MKKTIILLSLIGIIISGKSYSQDVHFSQFYATPLQINPAMTGVFDGVARISNSYRSQWTGLGKGYSTIHFSADAPVGKGNLGTNFFGAGLLLYQDKAGTSGFKHTVLQGSLSFTAAMDGVGDHFFSVGFQGGLNQFALDLTKTTWDSQWNGDDFDPSLNSFESIQLQQFSYLDLNAGVLYYYVPDGDNTFSAGASLSHIGSPNVSFFTESDAPLRRKITVHGGGDFVLNKDKTSWIDPRFMVLMQGKQTETMLGGYIKNKVQFKSRYTNFRKEAYFYLGGFYRINDAGILSARFEYNTLGLGLSYDFNASNLSRLGGSANAFELNISYIAPVKRGQREKQFNKMPRFL